MTLREAWREVKYQIADKLFTYELDDAYQMGIREGATYATRKITFNIELKRSRMDMTKTQQIGYDKAIANLGDLRKEIKESTGAMFL